MTGWTLPDAAALGAVVTASDQTVGNSILGNSIRNNSGLGIELGDSDDPFYGFGANQGPNHWQPEPGLFEADEKILGGG